MTARKLTSTGNIERLNGRSSMVSGVDEVAQRCAIVLNTARNDNDPRTGEAMEGAYIWDRELGTRVISIVGTVNSRPNYARAVLASDLSDVRGVTGIGSIEIEQTGVASLTWTATIEAKIDNDANLRVISGSIQ